MRQDEPNTEDTIQAETTEAGISRGDILKTTAKAGAALGLGGLLAEGGLLSALAATKDTKGKGQFTGWAGLSQGEVNILRLVVTDPNTRAAFIKNPKNAIKQSGEKLTPAQIANLSRISKLQVNSFVTNVQGSVAAGTAGTHTLLYAVVFAIIVACLLAVEGVEGSPTAGGAVPIF